MRPSTSPYSNIYIFSSSFIIAIASPFFVFRKYLKSIKNPKAHKSHIFVLSYELITFAILILYWLIFSQFNPFNFLSFFALLGIILQYGSILWILAFVAAKSYFKLTKKQALFLMIITTFTCLSAIGINMLIFFNLIVPNFKYCEESILCLRNK